MRKTKIKIGRSSFFIPHILLIVVAGLVVRLLLSGYGTLALDQSTFVAWSNRLTSVPLGDFYEIWSDYLPGYLYVLWFLGWVQRVLPIPQVLLFKLPAILSDVVSGFLIYVIVKELKDQKWGLVASALYLFNPAVLANSTLWGQVDSLTVLFSILAIWLVDRHLGLSSLALAVGTLIKPQAALAAPAVFFVMLRKKRKAKDILKYVVFSLAIFVLGFVPFSGDKGLLAFILERIQATLNQYPYTSINAFNFWGLFGFWKKEGTGAFSAQTVGLAIFFFVFFLAFIKLWKKRKAEYLLAAVVFVLSFLFFTRMHERHLLPTLAPLAIASSLSPALWIAYAGFSLTYIANLYYSFVWITKDFTSVFPSLVIKILIFANLAFFAILFSRASKIKTPSFSLGGLGRLMGSWKEKVEPVERKRPSRLPKKLTMLLLALILLFSFISRVAWLGRPEHEYFDEVYHAFTARRMLNEDPKAWEWWNTPPSGFAYEWTHPPLAKEGMVLGMILFGENSFGWRIPGVLVGVGSVFLVYAIARLLFKDELVGLLSSAVFALDGLPLVMSRIGMNDSYFLFFTLSAIYLFLKDKNFLSALSLGLAAASKWSFVWAFPILLLSHFVLKRKLKPGYLWFLLIPPAVYVASYIPMFLTGHGFDIFVGVQKQMWWYHTRLSATHPFTSPWWSWPIMARPIWLYTSGARDGLVANIYAMGNPLVFWAGLASVGLCAYYSFVQRSKTLGLIVFSYLIFFVPWAVSPRIMFLYHYLPSLPFLAIALGFVLKRYWRIAPYLIGVALFVFLYFYPRLIGLPTTTFLGDSYRWFSSW